MAPRPVIDVAGLSVGYKIGRRWFDAIRDVDLKILPLQTHGLVGESGSGKSTLGLAIMRYLAHNARITKGSIRFGDADLHTMTDRELEGVWGSRITLVPQNPMEALNPSLRIGRQMTETTRRHDHLSESAAIDRAVAALRQVQIADPERVIRRYPHQLSGGMLQRVMIAMALSTRPALVVLDEPTTALDVTTQAVILDLLRDLIAAEHAAALYVSHDLGAVAQLCDYVTVLYAGEVMESAPVDALFTAPRHPYTAGLLACLPSAATGDDSRLTTISGIAPSLAERSSACVFAPRCPLATAKCHAEKPPLEPIEDRRTVRCWHWRDTSLPGAELPNRRHAVRSSSARPPVLEATDIVKWFAPRRTSLLPGRATRDVVQALNGASIRVAAGSTFGLVGESGSGKTTLARSILALAEADRGSLRLMDRPIALRLGDRERETLRNLRIVFQNPDDSLNPYRTVGQTIGRTIRKLAPESADRTQLRSRVEALLNAVGLPAKYYDRLPSRLSGGEKQRVAIARAFASKPALIVADEPTSSLDVSVQAVILNLLKDLRAREGISYVIISHDLAVVRYLADRIAVMYLGEIVEQGPTDAVLAAPSHPYTEALLSAIPLPDPRVRRHPIALTGEAPSPRNRPTGCAFHTRCPRKIGSICETTAPPTRTTANGLEIRCHYRLDQLRAMQASHRPHSGAPG